MKWDVGDRVCLPTLSRNLFGTVVDVAYDGELKVVLDGDDVGMYYHPAAFIPAKEEA